MCVLLSLQKVKKLDKKLRTISGLMDEQKYITVYVCFAFAPHLIYMYLWLPHYTLFVDAMPHFHSLSPILRYEEAIEKLLTAEDMVEEITPYLLRIRSQLCQAYGEVSRKSKGNARGCRGVPEWRGWVKGCVNEGGGWRDAWVKEVTNYICVGREMPWAKEVGRQKEAGRKMPDQRLIERCRRERGG